MQALLAQAVPSAGRVCRPLGVCFRVREYWDIPTSCQAGFSSCGMSTSRSPTSSAQLARRTRHKLGPAAPNVATGFGVICRCYAPGRRRFARMQAAPSRVASPDTLIANRRTRRCACRVPAADETDGPRAEPSMAVGWRRGSSSAAHSPTPARRRAGHRAGRRCARRSRPPETRVARRERTEPPPRSTRRPPAGSG